MEGLGPRLGGAQGENMVPEARGSPLPAQGEGQPVKTAATIIGQIIGGVVLGLADDLILVLAMDKFETVIESGHGSGNSAHQFIGIGRIQTVAAVVFGRLIRKGRHFAAAE